MIGNTLRAAVKFHPIPVSLLFTSRFFLDEYQHVPMRMFGWSFTQASEVRAQIEWACLSVIGMMILSKIGLIFANLPRANHRNFVVDFIIRNHWFFLSSTFMAQHLIFRDGDSVAKALEWPEIYVHDTIYSMLGLAILIQIFIVTFLRQFEGALEHYEEAHRMMQQKADVKENTERLKQDAVETGNCKKGKAVISGGAVSNIEQSHRKSKKAQ